MLEAMQAVCVPARRFVHLHLGYNRTPKGVPRLVAISAINIALLAECVGRFLYGEMYYISPNSLPRRGHLCFVADSQTILVQIAPPHWS